MAVWALGDLVPMIDPQAFIHPDATVIGDVRLGPDTTVWPSAVLRGDFGTISVGAGTSIQDGSVLHAGPGFPTVVGDSCVVGHIVHLEGCVLEDECLVGSGAIVLHHATVGTGATVGAGAVVLAGMQVPPGALAVGVPATIKPGGSRIEVIRVASAEYIENGRRYREQLRRVD
ncbi:MAG TPA: gamma carbonic anhydrase family protein [Acidimicrobiales bacterium]|nr:gamma carbonic anhydrase family protein [Acidimicrobiales bacterium]